MLCISRRQQWHFPDNALWLVARTRGDARGSIERAIKSAIWSVDKEQPIMRVATFERGGQETSIEAKALRAHSFRGLRPSCASAGCNRDLRTAQWPR